MFLIQLSTDNLYLCADHVKFLMPFAPIYAYVNYQATLARGEPLYWFLTWEDYTSVLVIIAIFVTFSIAWVLVAKFTQAFKKDLTGNDSVKKE